jgi:predicted histidine transporter YuiF (NhaC family)
MELELKEGGGTKILIGIISALFIIGFNIAICWNLRRSRKFRRQHSDAESSAEQEQQKSSATRVLLAVSVTYVLLVSPFTIAYIVTQFVRYEPKR